MHGHSEINSADTEWMIVILEHWNSDISFISPSRSPWISNNHVVLTISSSPTNSFNCVVHFSIAIQVIKNSTLVVSEWIRWSIQRDRNRANWETLLESKRRAIVLFCTENFNSNFSLIVSAVLVLGNIRIVLSKFKTVILHVGISGLEQSTITSIICVWSWAINQLLLWEGQKFAILDSIMLLSGAHCWEWPATSAILLILYGANNSLSSPVHRDIVSGKRAFMLNNSRHFSHFIRRSVTEESRKFLISHICELIESESVSDVILWVVLRNESQLLIKECLSHFILLFGSITFSKLCTILYKHIILIWKW